MADRLSWWVIPGALVVLTRVVTLGGPDDDAASRGVVREAAHADDVVVLRDATGHRRKPASWSALTATALVVRMPDAFAGRTAQVSVWQHGAKTGTPAWLAVDAPVRADGALPIAGLAAGRYDVRVTFAAGDMASRFLAVDVAAPGECVMGPSAAPAAPTPVR